MARAYLQEANLPKNFWFWAVREAFFRMNLLPVNIGPRGTKHSEQHLSTPFELFYGCKPDMCVLFKFGSVGFFYRPVDGSRSRTKFEVQTFPGIALGRSDTTNGMIFWCPETKRFCTAADYFLDESRHVRNFFPELVNNGGFELKLCEHGLHGKAIKHPPGSTVTFRLPGPVQPSERPLFTSGEVIGLPMKRGSPYYTVKLQDDTTVALDPAELWEPDDALAGLELIDDPDHSDPTSPVRPAWLIQNCHVRFNHQGQMLRGYLKHTDSYSWCFRQRDRGGRVITDVPIPDLDVYWQHYLLEGLLIVGWDEPDVTLESIESGLSDLVGLIPRRIRWDQASEYIHRGGRS
ncbi:Reverse transcriptase (RNA-dependent DNA polymerase) [Seminavis robusta]|uniref:Reverse transcriptase (RNA-dependent DNA polymerase) n=1 Tax=Seminavis robusta TaxID=568900 RepID=A0A9N8HRA0_9STRA|nr:Reverse transcriptase (RNA-dependent DNA polymerase) [Seminavis robusta]|eukprot:Sro1294_g260160.1 Reverse transcriptase (RNA-dependent DNA polymerase) (348) ;mRNA; f:7059-8173